MKIKNSHYDKWNLPIYMDARYGVIAICEDGCEQCPNRFRCWTEIERKFKMSFRTFRRLRDAATL